jgi:beta-fructofuranosidase
VLQLDEDWVWDFWLADDGTAYHAFFLAAPRTLGDPELRHTHARIGHAVSADLRSWTRLPDALHPEPGSGFDDVATWTGSVLQGPGGRWWMFYTGACWGGKGLVQRIGAATSDDLVHWRKHPGNPLLVADRRWYELAGDDGAVGEEWRDPWVFADPAGEGWHMLITARAAGGAADDRGVVGHAASSDLEHWRVAPPLTGAGSGFAHLEVTQPEIVDGRAVLLFSCLRDRFATGRAAGPGTGGVWAAAGESLLGPFDVAGALPLTGDEFYSGRLVRDRSGQWVLLAFHHTGADGSFGGRISDPLPVGWSPDGRLALRTPSPGSHVLFP